MATQVEEGGDFTAARNYFLPVLILVRLESFGDELVALLIETHDFMADRTGSE